MTRELLEEANRLSHAISGLENQIAIIEDMHHCNNNLTLEVDTIGAVTIPSVLNELKDDILNTVLNRLNKVKDSREDKLRLL